MFCNLQREADSDEGDYQTLGPDGDEDKHGYVTSAFLAAKKH